MISSPKYFVLVLLVAACCLPLIADDSKVSGGVAMAAFIVRQEGGQKICWVLKNYETEILKQVDLGFPPVAGQDAPPTIRRVVFQVMGAAITADGVGPPSVLGVCVEQDPEGALPRLKWVACLTHGKSDQEMCLILAGSRGSAARILLLDIPVNPGADLVLKKPKVDHKFIHIGGISRISAIPRPEGILIAANSSEPRLGHSDYFLDYKTMKLSEITVGK